MVSRRVKYLKLIKVKKLSKKKINFHDFPVDKSWYGHAMHELKFFRNLSAKTHNHQGLNFRPS